MITREEAERLRGQLMLLLAEDAHNTERLVSRLDSITQETGIGAHAALLLILTQLPFEEDEARGHWQEILDHRAKLSVKMGRDAGMRVALLDYFMNINRRLTQPMLIDLEMRELDSPGAETDRLTGLATDRRFRHALQDELRRARRYSQKTSVVLVDIDEFADANQRVGRLVADRLLRECAILLANNIRDIDLAARPGEDEFALLLPETDGNGGLLVAERFRRTAESFFAGREGAGGPVELTVSAGVASYPGDATTAETLLQRAAQALYQAKALGRNAVQRFLPERRRYLRFELEPGRFEVEVLAPQERADARVRNLSRNGILFTSPEPLDVGESIEIRLADAGEHGDVQALVLRGRVVRLEELPEPDPVTAADGQPVARDRYEIGVALDLEWAEGTSDLLDFLERAHDRSTGRPS